MSVKQPHPNADVRMRGFAQRSTVEESLTWLDAQLPGLLSVENSSAEKELRENKSCESSSDGSLRSEFVGLGEAAGRVLAEDLTSRVNVPGFERAMMDGFAVQAADTSGASPYHRAPLRVIGESLPGVPFAGTVEAGTAVRIMTGAPHPRGADAVIPCEKTSQARSQDALDQKASPGEAEIFLEGEIPPGKHVGRVGEDISRGTVVLKAGRVLRPQDIGVISSISVAQVPVVRRPRVRLLITGNELVPAGSTAAANQTVDANGPMLAALVRRDGGEPIEKEIVRDERDAILDALNDEVDVVLVSGGSSVGAEDFVPTLLAKHGELAIHGVAMRPSSPVGMGKLGQRLVFLLPGNPVSCLCAYDFFAGRAIRSLGGRKRDWPYQKVTARLSRKLVSQVGRVDYARVTLSGEPNALHAESLAVSGSSILTSATRADGFVIVRADSEGFAEEAEVEVFLYDLVS